MKQIIININKPYAKYFALKKLNANIEAIFEKFEVKENDNFFKTNIDIMRRILQIMDETEYYKRGNFHESFSCNYHWDVLPNKEQPEIINIRSVTGKPVGTITVINK